MSEEPKSADPLRRPYLTLPGATGMPDVGEILAHMAAQQGGVRQIPLWSRLRP